MRGVENMKKLNPVAALIKENEVSTQPNCDEMLRKLNELCVVPT
jgi:hypothetical protein